MQDNDGINFQEIMSESVDWMDLVQNRYKWNTLTKMQWIFGFHDMLSFY